MTLVERILPDLPVATLLAIYSGGFVLLLLELVVPGVVVGLLGGLTMLWALACGYQHDRWVVSTSLLVFSIVTIPKILVGGINRLALQTQFTQGAGYQSVTEPPKALVGREGVVHSTLRPAGVVMIDGEKLDAMAEPGMIDEGKRVRVLRTQGYQVVVRET
ncbi:MAG: NfeD family protein [Planctomycetes bacterium]|nr:NfeD family protein [Planctomycetota bacterium]